MADAFGARPRWRTLEVHHKHPSERTLRMINVFLTAAAVALVRERIYAPSENLEDVSSETRL
jgi:hypothetical protein